MNSYFFYKLDKFDFKANLIINKINKISFKLKKNFALRIILNLHLNI